MRSAARAARRGASGPGTKVSARAARIPCCEAPPGASAGSMRAAETAARGENAAAAHGGGRRRRPPLRPDRFPVGWSVGRPWSEPSESHGSVGSVGRLSRSLEPLRRPWLAAQRPILAVAQRVVGLDERVELAGALVDDGGLRVAQVALDRELVRVAVRAVDLDRVERARDGVVRGVPFRERRLARVAEAAVLERSRPARRAAGRPRSRRPSSRSSA